MELSPFNGNLGSILILSLFTINAKNRLNSLVKIYWFEALRFRAHSARRGHLDVSNTVELSQAQMAELHRRIAEHCADPSAAVPWEQVRAKLFLRKP